MRRSRSVKKKALTRSGDAVGLTRVATTFRRIVQEEGRGEFGRSRERMASRSASSASQSRDSSHWRAVSEMASMALWNEGKKERLPEGQRDPPWKDRCA